MNGTAGANATARKIALVRDVILETPANLVPALKGHGLGVFAVAVVLVAVGVVASSVGAEVVGALFVGAKVVAVGPYFVDDVGGQANGCENADG